MKSFVLFSITALAEIVGCCATYAVLRQGRHPLWPLAGVAALALFAWLLTLHPTEGTGRIYAAYGGVYITSSLLWLWRVEGIVPDRFDLKGGFLCLLGAGVIILAPRPSPPDSAPADGGPPGANTLILNEKRVSSLNLTLHIVAEVEGEIFIPADSLQAAQDSTYLWVEDFELANTFIKARVTTGCRNGEMIEIQSGILPGDKVVVQGATKLRFECNNIKRPPVETHCDEGHHVKAKHLL